MEKFSKKGKRGRPLIGGDEYRSIFDGLHQDASKRTLNNRLWQQQAFGLLHDKPDYSWLIETTPAGNFRRSTLLAELGRIGDPDAILVVAAKLCEAKPKVRDGVQMIRNFRKRAEGKELAKGDPDKLADELRKVLNDFISRYPETDKDLIQEALDQVCLDVDVSL